MRALPVAQFTLVWAGATLNLCRPACRFLSLSNSMPARLPIHSPPQLPTCPLPPHLAGTRSPPSLVFQTSVSSAAVGQGSAECEVARAGCPHCMLRCTGAQAGGPGVLHSTGQQHAAQCLKAPYSTDNARMLLLHQSRGFSTHSRPPWTRPGRPPAPPCRRAARPGGTGAGWAARRLCAPALHGHAGERLGSSFGAAAQPLGRAAAQAT